jgi:hypothetical protein
MPIWVKRSILGLATAAVACLVVGALALPADAGKSKTKKAEGKLVRYDVEAATITVKEKGREKVYAVKAEGSVLTRTTVTMNAQPAKLDDLPEGAPVIVYWIRDENDPKKRFARKIDAPKVPDELLEGYD